MNNWLGSVIEFTVAVPHAWSPARLYVMKSLLYICEPEPLLENMGFGEATVEFWEMFIVAFAPHVRHPPRFCGLDVSSKDAVRVAGRYREAAICFCHVIRLASCDCCALLI